MIKKTERLKWFLLYLAGIVFIALNLILMLDWPIKITESNINHFMPLCMIGSLIAISIALTSKGAIQTVGFLITAAVMLWVIFAAVKVLWLTTIIPIPRELHANAIHKALIRPEDPLEQIKQILSAIWLVGWLIIFSLYLFVRGNHGSGDEK